MAQFDQTLNSMIDALGCSNKELAAACELSASALSRYRNGNRKPTSTGKTVARLAEGIASIAQRVGITEYSNAATVQQRLLGSLSNKSRSLAFADKLNSLMNTLGLYNTKLAEYIGIDASYLSRIRAGYRYPAHVREFAMRCARYATLHADHSTQAPLAALLKAQNPALSLPSFNDTDAIEAAIVSWLTTDDNSRTAEQEDALGFLKSINDFDFGAFYENVHRESTSCSNLTDTHAREFLQHPHAELAYAVEDMRETYLQLYRIASLSPKSRELFICSGLPMDELLGDGAYYTRWVSALLDVLSSGVHVSLIHNLDRSYREIIRSLIVWLPLYATGMVTPYYLEGVHDRIFRRAHFVSNAAALYGECIGDDVSNGMHRLTTEPQSVRYYQRKAEIILDHAKPLMDVYTAKDVGAFEKKMAELSSTRGDDTSYLSSLPLFTMPPELLQRILERAGLDNSARARLRISAAAQRANVETFLSHSKKHDYIVGFDEASFAPDALRLQTERAFMEETVLCEPSEYAEHLEATRAFAHAHPNYSFSLIKRTSLNALQVSLRGSSCAIVAKAKGPALVLAIYHPRIAEIIGNLGTLVEDAG